MGVKEIRILFYSNASRFEGFLISALLVYRASPKLRWAFCACGLSAMARRR